MKVDRQLDHKLKINKSEDLVHYIHEYDIDLESNHIYLMGVDRGYDISGIDEPGIEYMISKRFIKNINLCMRVNPNKPILIHLKSCGGFWEEGMAVYDAIKSCSSPVTILNYTHARSMSSLIFQAGDKRIMMPHSIFMFHDGTYAIEGTVKQVRNTVEFDKKNDLTMLEIYANRMNEKGSMAGQGADFIKTWLRDQMDKREDVYLTSEETVEVGLADSIFDYNWKNLIEY